MGQSSGWLMSRNSITPSRALRTIGDLVFTSGGSPFGPGRQSRTAHAQLATGFGEPASSTRHMRQLPAIDSRSWKQKRGISAPAASHACSSVYSGGTSTSLPSTTSLVMPASCQTFAFPAAPLPDERKRDARDRQGLGHERRAPFSMEPSGQAHERADNGENREGIGRSYAEQRPRPGA